MLSLFIFVGLLFQSELTTLAVTFLLFMRDNTASRHSKRILGVYEYFQVKVYAINCVIGVFFLYFGLFLRLPMFFSCSTLSSLLGSGMPDLCDFSPP